MAASALQSRNQTRNWLCFMAARRLRPPSARKRRCGSRSRNLFDPTNPDSAACNPLLEVRRGEWEGRDVQSIADVLVDPEGALERRNHWETTSHSLLVGAILHVLYAEPDKTLAGVANFLSDPSRPIMGSSRRLDGGLRAGASSPTRSPMTSIRPANTMKGMCSRSV